MFPGRKLGSTFWERPWMLGPTLKELSAKPVTLRTEQQASVTPSPNPMDLGRKGRAKVLVIGRNGF